MRPYIYITRRLPQLALDVIAANCDYAMWDSADEAVPRSVLLAAVREAAGVLTMVSDRIDAELLDAAPKLKVVANMAVGYDNIDLPALQRRGVVLTNTPDVLTETTADLAWALLLSAARRVVEGQQLIATGGWKSWSPLFMVGQDVAGAILGIVGAGRIGTAVARRAQGFAMPVLYHNRRPSPELEAQTSARYRPLDLLLREADFIVVTAPLTPETRGMFGAREFALMKQTAVFVNVARGPIIRELELVEALKQGRPWAAGLDVFEREPIGPDHPLLALPNVVVVPHIGSATTRTRMAMATTAAKNVVAVVGGHAALHPVL